MNRVTFLIDGFNLYHSTLDFRRYTGKSVKWLNLRSLCASYIHMFGKDARLEAIYYFSAPPYYLTGKDPNKIKRYDTYLSCLRGTGINLELARFKAKEVFCDRCNTWIIKHEEKETDVAIAVKTMELFIKRTTDTVAIMSGDTDLVPLVRTCRSVFPDKRILFVFPYARKNKELTDLAPGSFSIRKKQYIKHQFPNPVVLPDGREIYKPAEW